MEKLFYPAIFTKSDNGYSVRFPDVESCITQGNNLSHAYEMAFEALGLVLSYFEENNIPVPAASEPFGLCENENEFVAVIEFDMLEYKKRVGSYAVKKTLSIPSWLNYEAEKAGINFSQTLQEALKVQLDLL